MCLTQSGKKARVLVVDDQPMNIDALSEILEENYIVQVATRGVKALEIASGNNPPDLILLDIMMPEMDGYEVCRRLKFDEKIHDIPVIFVTAKDSAEDEEYGLQLGAADYIKKPFIPAVVLARVLTHLQLKKHREHLEDLVKERTSQLSEANKRISALDHDKLHFLRYLSHEMRTPLNYIGASQIIEKTELGEENLKIISMIEKGFDRLSILTDQVISYFELAGQDLATGAREISLGQAVLSTVKKHEGAAELSNLSIQTRLSDDITVTANADHLAEVLDILMENAVVFSETGGTVTIESERDNKNVRLSFCDEGRGIDENDLEKIFKPFATEEPSRHEGGYGLNLPRVRIIADAHGWRIRAESKGKGHGTKFIIDF